MNICIEWLNTLPVVIVEHPTGVKYAGQVGGMSCLHPEVEGFILPLSSGEWNQLEGLSCGDPCHGYPLTESVCDVLEKNWPEQKYMEYTVYLDRERMKEGTECWFPVIIKTPLYKPCGGDLKLQNPYSLLNNKKGWLLMPDNCD